MVRSPGSSHEGNGESQKNRREGSDRNAKPPKELWHAPERSPTPTLPGGPLLGPQPGKYLGQIVIEVWQPDDPARSDGLTFQAHRTDTSDIQAIDQFVH